MPASLGSFTQVSDLATFYIKNQIITGNLRDFEREFETWANICATSDLTNQDPTESAEDADAMYNELMAELDEEVQETGREEDEELNTLWNIWAWMINLHSVISLFAEIAEEVSNVNVEEPEGESETDVMEIEEEPQPVTSREAAEALNVLQRYADVNANPEIQLLCDKVDNVLAKKESS
uniref:Uncharacterized protein n=1 Tax=Ditylenchus dipsaci TaxID=166011 RepID=A0A915CY52_9BILA